MIPTDAAAAFMAMSADDASGVVEFTTDVLVGSIEVAGAAVVVTAKGAPVEPGADVVPGGVDVGEAVDGTNVVPVPGASVVVSFGATGT